MVKFPEYNSYFHMHHYHQAYYLTKKGTWSYKNYWGTNNKYHDYVNGFGSEIINKYDENLIFKL